MGTRWIRREPTLRETGESEDAIDIVDDDIKRIVLNEESNCWIEIPEKIDIQAGVNIITIKYFVGNPIHARRFGLCFYKSLEDQIADVNPITDKSILPEYSFFPERPLPDRLNSHVATLTINLTQDLPFEKLSISILLLT